MKYRRFHTFLILSFWTTRNSDSLFFTRSSYFRGKNGWLKLMSQSMVVKKQKYSLELVKLFSSIFFPA